MKSFMKSILFIYFFLRSASLSSSSNINPDGNLNSKAFQDKFSKFISSFYLANGKNSCGTWILIRDSVQIQLSNHLIPYITLQPKNLSASSAAGVSDYLTHEWSYEELKNSVVFGHLKHSNNCAVNLISWNSESFVEKILSKILWGRFSRVALDYFIFIANEFYLIEDYSNILNVLARRSLLKYESEGPTCNLKNICTRGNSEEIPEKCKDFVNGKRFEVAVTAAAPLVSFKILPGGKITGRGVQYKMLEAASKHFNHTFGIHVSIGKGTGSRLKNGSCIGTSGEIYHGRGDIGFPLGNSLTRHKVMDSTSVFEFTRLTFVYKNPSPQIKWQALFWSFPNNVWLAISVTFLLLIPVLWLVLSLDRRNKIKQKFGVTIKFLLEIFLEQDSSLLSNSKMSFGFRIITVTWMSGSLILGTAYRSKLVSFLTFPIVENVPDTFQKLADSDYKISFKYYGGVAYSGFQTSNFSSFKKIFLRLNMERDLYKCMENVVLKEKTVCVVYLEAANYMVANNFTLSAASSHSIIGEAKEFAMLVPLVYAFRKGSPLTAIYNDIIGIFKASGLHDEWMRKDLVERKKVSTSWFDSQDEEKIPRGKKNVKIQLQKFFDELDTSLKPLFIKNLLGPFGLLMLGLVISFITFIFEHLKKRVC